jgi:hypothetical protein
MKPCANTITLHAGIRDDAKRLPTPSRDEHVPSHNAFEFSAQIL